MDIPLLTVVEIADGVGGAVLDERCEECGWHLIQKPGRLPFCWNCVTNRECARKGHDLLVKARLAWRGVEFLPEKPTAKPGDARPREDERPIWRDGSTL